MLLFKQLSNFEAGGAMGMNTPLVGRSKANRGQTIGVTHEPDRGKSRSIAVIGQKTEIRREQRRRRALFAKRSSCAGASRLTPVRFGVRDAGSRA
jgi:hypothetical protein